MVQMRARVEEAAGLVLMKEGFEFPAEVETLPSTSSP